MVAIAEYDPRWADDFQHEKKCLLEALASSPIMMIEHVGSTAILGLASKPVIDIMIAVKNLDVINESVIDAICSLGYKYRPDLEEEMPFRRYFNKNDAQGKRTHQIHVVPYMSPFWNRLILFRDYLRVRTDRKNEYADLKCELAKMHAKKSDYTKAKSDFINLVILESITLS